ncbi:MAG: YeeE/YedE family protein [Polyangiaceae bacterium]|nr:YeeE/YedE family protein [Polyangiaceae bacterium]
MRHVAALFAGLLFSVGLALSGMTQPAKVIGFLDLAGRWDPSLAFVMLGAIGVHFVLYRLVLRRPSPLFSGHFELPTRRDLDRRLLIGSGIFGVGWALGGYCPGPALVAMGGLSRQALLFTVSMIVGMLVFTRVRQRDALSPADASL